jgi:hypothetical protein
MNLLEEYKNSDVIGFSFSPIDYIEEKIMPDENLNPPEDAPLRSMEGLPEYITSIKENGIFQFDDKTIVLRGDQLYDWIIDENLNVHNVAFNMPAFFTLEIHDGSEMWQAIFYVNDEPVEI